MHHPCPPSSNQSASFADPPSASPEPAGAALPGTVFLHKRCHTCGEEKALTAFYPLPNKSGHRRDCKRCLAAKNQRQCTRIPGSPAPEGKRRCRHCGENRPHSHFPSDRRSRSGIGSTCTPCRSQRAAGLAALGKGLNRPDALITQNTRLFERRMDLGIAILHAITEPGQCRTLEEIAAYAGVSPEAIRRIEMRALEKLRAKALELLAVAGVEDPNRVAL